MTFQRNVKVVGFALGILLVLFMIPCTVPAVPQEISYQGYLTDTGQNPLNGTYVMRFVLYDSTGNPVWSEEQHVVVADGIYTIQLGSEMPLTVDLFETDEAYLGVEIYNNETESWEYFVPRQRLTSTAYAFQAENARSLEGQAGAAFAPVVHQHSGADITSGTVDEARIDPDVARDSEINWENLTGIPVDIADGDQVGLTAETDPTITAPSIKDGVSWGELSGIPSGFADGVDNTGLTESSDYGRSGVSSTLYEGTTALSSKYVGKSGSQTITNGNLTVNTHYGMGTAAVTGVKGFSQSETYGYGVFGEASGSDGYGVYGGATGSSGAGVYGEAANMGGVTNYGGYFVARGTTGKGVYGEAPYIGVHGSGSGSNARGVYGEAASTDGTGVYGEAPLYGVHGRAWGSNALGVYGEATGSDGSAVYGWAGNTGAVENYGGHFTAKGAYGRGVYGEAGNASDATNHGGFFIAHGTTGRGVYGGATGSSGRGVYGKASNTGDVENYGGYFVAEGTDGMGVYAEATGLSGHAVYGHATNTEASFNHGGIFKADGIQGIAVYAEATNQGEHQNYGGWFTARGSRGIGVTGNGKLYNFLASGTGIDYGSFTGAHEVRLAEELSGEIRPGMIVSVSGRVEAREKENGEISLSSTLSTVALARKAMDKAVFGVFVTEAPLPKDYWYEAQEGDRFGVVNALGEGRVLVTNITGEIEAGDHITTSAIPGYGQKQDDDLLHSYTLGKSIETVDWETVTETIEYNGRMYKVYLIAVVYMSG